MIIIPVAYNKCGRNTKPTADQFDLEETKKEKK